MHKNNLFALLAFLLLLPRLVATNTYENAESGKYLTQDEVTVLESELEFDPFNLHVRTKLLGYYFVQSHKDKSARTQQSKHVLWLVKNTPDAEVLGLSFGMLHPLEKEAQEELGRLWKNKIAKDPGNLIFLKHASRHLVLEDSGFVQECLLKGFELNPEDHFWSNQLGHLHWLNSLSVDGTHHEDGAKKALYYFEKAFSLLDAKGQDALLSSLAKAAFAAHAFEKAKKYAEKMLVSNFDNWNTGNNIHFGNIILGRLAFHQGDIEKAKDYLIKAGQTHGSPQLNSFGPTMALASELLERNESEAVLRYLDLCRTFWAHGEERLSAWKTAIEMGDAPDFRPNMGY